MGSWGGRRPGAGRKPKTELKNKKSGSGPVSNKNMLPLDYLLGVMRDDTVDIDRRLKAAKCAAQYCHKKGDRSQKDATNRAAEKAGSGKFSAGKPPLRLIRNDDNK